MVPTWSERRESWKMCEFNIFKSGRCGTWLVVTGTWLDYFPRNMGNFIIPIDEVSYFSEGWLNINDQPGNLGCSILIYWYTLIIFDPYPDRWTVENYINLPSWHMDDNWCLDLPVCVGFLLRAFPELLHSLGLTWAWFVSEIDACQHCMTMVSHLASRFVWKPEHELWTKHRRRGFLSSVDVNVPVWAWTCLRRSISVPVVHQEIDIIEDKG